MQNWFQVQHLFILFLSIGYFLFHITIMLIRLFCSQYNFSFIYSPIVFVPEKQIWVSEWNVILFIYTLLLWKIWFVKLLQSNYITEYLLLFYTLSNNHNKRVFYIIIYLSCLFLFFVYHNKIVTFYYFVVLFWIGQKKRFHSKLHAIWFVTIVQYNTISVFHLFFCTLIK